MSASSRSRSTAVAEASGIRFIAPPEISGLRQHPVIADDGDLTGQRRLDAAFANSALERLEGVQRGKRGAALFRLDEMNEAIVIEPQRQIADAIRRLGLQFLEHFCDQSRIQLCRIRLCL